MENKYPEYVMAILRQRLDLEADDTSRDTEINLYTPNEAFEELLAWEGFIGYASHVKMWINDIFGVDLNEVSDNSEWHYDENEDNPFEQDEPRTQITCANGCSFFYKDRDKEEPYCHHSDDDGTPPCKWNEEEFDKWEEEFDDSEAWEDDSDRGCKDCPPDECTGNCMSCYYRPV